MKFYLHKLWGKVCILLIILSFIIDITMPSLALAQQPWMPNPGTRVALSDPANAAFLKGITIDPKDPFKFDFIIDRGDLPLSELQKREEYNNLIKYFLAALAVPDDEQWVNLSPYEKDRIITDNFGKTEMGRDLLAQDYLLKQITASVIYPQDKLGQTFWRKIYAEAAKKFGSTNIPINTFNKVWIVPEKAVVYENAKTGTVYIVESRLKVMLEEDYLSMEKNNVGADLGVSPIAGQTRSAPTDASKIGSQIIRQIIIPALTKEINEGKNFAPLRQVYSGMLLATWYKRSLKESLLNQKYTNQGKIKGIDQDPQSNKKIYQQYLTAFKKGVFNLIKEDIDTPSGRMIPRKYFSGGTEGYNRVPIVRIVSLNADQAMYARGSLSHMDIVRAKVQTTQDSAMLSETEQMIKVLEEEMKDKSTQDKISLLQGQREAMEGISSNGPFGEVIAWINITIDELNLSLKAPVVQDSKDTARLKALKLHIEQTKSQIEQARRLNGSEMHGEPYSVSETDNAAKLAVGISRYNRRNWIFSLFSYEIEGQKRVISLGNGSHAFRVITYTEMGNFIPNDPLAQNISQAHGSNWIYSLFSYEVQGKKRIISTGGEGELFAYKEDGTLITDDPLVKSIKQAHTNRNDIHSLFGYEVQGQKRVISVGDEGDVYAYEENGTPINNDRLVQSIRQAHGEAIYSVFGYEFQGQKRVISMGSSGRIFAYEENGTLINDDPLVKVIRKAHGDDGIHSLFSYEIEGRTRIISVGDKSKAFAFGQDKIVPIAPNEIPSLEAKLKSLEQEYARLERLQQVAESLERTKIQLAQVKKTSVMYGEPYRVDRGDVSEKLIKAIRSAHDKGSILSLFSYEVDGQRRLISMGSRGDVFSYKEDGTLIPDDLLVKGIRQAYGGLLVGGLFSYQVGGQRRVVSVGQKGAFAFEENGTLIPDDPLVANIRRLHGQESIYSLFIYEVQGQRRVISVGKSGKAFAYEENGTPIEDDLIVKNIHEAHRMDLIYSLFHYEVRSQKYLISVANPASFAYQEDGTPYSYSKDALPASIRNAHGNNHISSVFIDEIQGQRRLISVGWAGEAFAFAQDKIESTDAKREMLLLESRLKSLEQEQARLERLQKLAEELEGAKAALAQARKVSDKVLYGDVSAVPSRNLPALITAIKQAHGNFWIYSIFSYEVQGQKRFISVGAGHNAFAYDEKGQRIENDALVASILKAHNKDVYSLFSYEFHGQRRVISIDYGGNIFAFEENGTPIPYDLLVESIRKAHGNHEASSLFSYDVEGQKRVLSVGRQGSVFAYLEDGTPIDNDPLVESIRREHSNEHVTSLFSYEVKGQRHVISIGEGAELFAYNAYEENGKLVLDDPLLTEINVTYTARGIYKLVSLFSYEFQNQRYLTSVGDGLFTLKQGKMDSVPNKEIALLESNIKSLEDEQARLERLQQVEEALVQKKAQLDQAKKAAERGQYGEPYAVSKRDNSAKLVGAIRKIYFNIQIRSLFSYEVNNKKRVITVGGILNAFAENGDLIEDDPLVKKLSLEYGPTWVGALFGYTFQGQKRVISVGEGGRVFSYDENGNSIGNDRLAKSIWKAHDGDSIYSLFSYEVEGQKRVISFGDKNKVFGFEEDGTPIDNDPLVKSIREAHDGETIHSLFNYEVEAQRKIISIGDLRSFTYEKDGTRSSDGLPKFLSQVSNISSISSVFVYESQGQRRLIILTKNNAENVAFVQDKLPPSPGSNKEIALLESNIKTLEEERAELEKVQPSTKSPGRESIFRKLWKGLISDAAMHSDTSEMIKVLVEPLMSNDSAMAVKKQHTPGGINMNPDHLDFQIQQDNAKMSPIQLQDFANIHIEGLVPVILEIKPASQSALLDQLKINAVR